MATHTDRENTFKLDKGPNRNPHGHAPPPNPGGENARPNASTDLASIGRANKRLKSRRGLFLSTRFNPRFFEEADQRLHIIKTIRKQVETLKSHCGCDSMMKELLCKRAIFISILLETMEAKAAEGGELDVGSYTQMSNGLCGLLKSLGLERKMKNAKDLKTYIEEREAK